MNVIYMAPVLRKMGMIATCPSLWHRMWQIVRMSESKWAAPFRRTQ